MATRLISILGQFLRGGEAEVLPNSWARIQIWRRFFEMQNEEENGYDDDIVVAMAAMTQPKLEAPIEIETEFCNGVDDIDENKEEEEEETSAAKPFFVMESAAQARRNFIKEGYRRMQAPMTAAPQSPDISARVNGLFASSSFASRPTFEEEDAQMYSPNLDIPLDGGTSHYARAQ